MIPLLVTLRIRGRRSLTLWLPLFLLWLLLLPIALLLLPFVLIAWAVGASDVFRAVPAFWDVLAGMRGTHIEVAVPDNAVTVHIY